MNRRQLIQWGLGILGMSAVTAVAAEKRAARPAAGAPAAGGAEPFVDPATDPMAKSVNFATKKSDVTKAELKVEKQGVKFEQQQCSNCMLYSAAGKKDGVEAGKCTLFAGKVVRGDSWCGSWAKKA